SSSSIAGGKFGRARKEPRDRMGEKWFSHAARFAFSDTWKMDLQVDRGSLSHMPCSWGGWFFKFDFQQMHVPSCEDAADLFIRPEVRAVWPDEELRLQRFLRPGDAVISGPCRTVETDDEDELLALRRFVALFGNLGGPFFADFAHRPSKEREVLHCRQQRRRDFPEKGAWATFCQSSQHPREAMAVVRRDGADTFNTCFIFHVALRVSPHWLPDCLKVMLKVCRQEVLRFQNRPKIQELRALNRDFYVVLTFRHFKRGPPLLPCEQNELPEVTLKEESQQSRWTRPCGGGFLAVGYLQKFLARLGLTGQVFDSLDGQKLVPYQCVVLRAEWQHLRGEVLRQFRAQKSAYRKLNGGPTAPDLREGLMPNFQAGDQPAPDYIVRCKPRLFVRHTFIDVNDSECSDMEMTRSASYK
ncbi:unnamed protein product, partial [Effrenium voratum]